jgi:NHS family xanthosine MFS transporter
VLQWKVDEKQFFLSAITALILGFYSFTLPKISPSKSINQSLSQRFGLDAFVLFKQKKIVIFLLFSILLGAILQTTNIWGVPFLGDFEINYPDSFAVQHSIFLMTLSQISEVLFILLIPFFLKKFGIKKVVLMSMIAWALRFGLFGVGSPEGIGLLFLILSMIIYGMAFDFFFISGSLFIDEVSGSKIRSSAQGLFMMMTGGFGPILGGYGSGYIVDLYTEKGIRDWFSIWFVFAFYALTIAIVFALVFKHKHVLKEK